MQQYNILAQWQSRVVSGGSRGCYMCGTYLARHPLLRVAEPELYASAFRDACGADVADGHRALHAVVEQHVRELGAGDERLDLRSVESAVPASLDARAHRHVRRAGGRGARAEVLGAASERRATRRGGKHERSGGHLQQGGSSSVGGLWAGAFDR